MRVLAWGTYDLGKPRARIMLKGLRDVGVDIVECHKAVWAGVEDKSQLPRWQERLSLALRWLTAYPALVYRYLRAPGHDAVLIPYMGQLDVLVLWPFAKLRRKPLVWDAFLSLYNTVVEDRRLVGPRHPAAFLLFAWEWLACRAADVVLLDTAAHGRYFVEKFRLRASKVHRVLVGAEPDVFFPADKPEHKRGRDEPFRVLFYGQFIPLHGIETIVKAAKLSEEDGVAWHLIGTGQQAEQIRSLIADLSPANLVWETWVPYDQLLGRIHDADLCLGIFGATEKAARVIPNKVYQIIASGKPLITADTPASRELLEPGAFVDLVPPADPEALRRAVLRMRTAEPPAQQDGLSALRTRIMPSAVVLPLRDLLARLVSRRTDSPAV